MASQKEFEQRLADLKQQEESVERDKERDKENKKEEARQEREKRRAEELAGVLEIQPIFEELLNGVNENYLNNTGSIHIDIMDENRSLGVALSWEGLDVPGDFCVGNRIILLGWQLEEQNKISKIILMTGTTKHRIEYSESEKQNWQGEVQQIIIESLENHGCGKVYKYPKPDGFAIGHL